MVPPSAAEPVPYWALRALVAAGAWTLFVSALLPIVDRDAGSWSPVHTHRAFGRVNLAHTHAYDANASADSTCDGSDGVVCAIEDDAGVGSGSLLAGSAPADSPGASVLTVSTLPVDERLRNVASAVTTPPPQL